MYLYNFPRITLRELSRGSGYSIKKTRESLFILILNRIVYYSVTENLRGQKVQYGVVSSNIIARQYFYNFRRAVSEELGPKCGLVYMEVAKYGQLSPASLAEKVKLGGLDISLNELDAALYRLINERYLMPTKPTDTLMPEDVIQKQYDKEAAHLSNLPLSSQSSRRLRQKIAEMNNPPNSASARPVISYLVLPVTSHT